MSGPSAPPFLIGPQGEDRFDRRSRYYGVARLTLTPDSGRQTSYLARRFVPAPESYAQVRPHVVNEGERPDVLAAAAIGSPLLQWRIADANRSFAIAETVATPGSTIAIPLDSGGSDG
jgi:hypothetical protein